MIEYGQAFWLALIQGLTEFLPISSSAHLILLPRLVNWSDQGLAFDVAVKDGRIKSGDKIIFEAFGGGFTWGSMLVQI